MESRIAKLALLVLLLAFGLNAQTRIKAAQVQGAVSTGGTVLVWDSQGYARLAAIEAPLMLVLSNGTYKLTVSGASQSGREVVEEALTPAGTATLQYAPVTGTVKLFRNGIRQRMSTDYTISGKVITWVAAPAADDTLLADYRTLE